MKNNIKSSIAASVITAGFLFVAIRPGVINMLGYVVNLLVFGQNTLESVMYEKTVIIAFDIICSAIVFFITYKVANRFFP